MSSTFIPSPGAAGGAELSYYVIYGSVFETGQLSAAVLLWRIYTFYMPIVVGLFFSKDLFGKKFDKSFSFFIKLGFQIKNVKISEKDIIFYRTSRKNISAIVYL